MVYHILLFSKLIEVFLKKGLQFRKRCGIITKPSDETANRIVGVDYNEGPPVPIPNTEVKLVCAENTRLATARDDRLAPTLRRITEMWFFFIFQKLKAPSVRGIFSFTLAFSCPRRKLEQNFIPSTGFTSRLTIFSKTTGKNVFRGNIVPRNIDIFVNLL